MDAKKVVDNLLNEDESDMTYHEDYEETVERLVRGIQKAIVAEATRLHNSYNLRDSLTKEDIMFNLLDHVLNLDSREWNTNWREK